MTELTNIVITGEPRTGKTTYAQSLTQKNKSIKISAAGAPLYEVLASLTTALVGIDSQAHDQTLIVDELNYGSYSTRDLIQIIREVDNVVNKVNSNRDVPLINTIIWVGTRMTLIKLVMDELTNQIMNDRFDVTSVKLQSVNKINDDPLRDYFADANKPFSVYTIDVDLKND